MDLLQFAGRLHILALHLPIGFLLLAFLMEIATRRSMPVLRPAVGFSLFWGMISAVLAAALGFLLSLDGSYDDTLLNWHKWLGIATALLSVALYFVQKKQAPSWLYLPMFGVTVVSLAAAGHFGGSLTHGSDFLFEKSGAESAAAQPITNLDSAQVFSDVILPVLKDKCGGCHNPSKRKGELVILSKEDILKGGESGPAVLPGKPAESPLLKGIQLPLEDEDHMPPKGKRQLADYEKQLLEWWITSGASFEKKVADAAMPENLRTALSAKTQAQSSPLAALKLSEVSDSKLKALREKGILAYPLASGSPLLQVSLSDRKDLSTALLKELEKIGENIIQLHLSNSNVDDEMLVILKKLPHLNRLYLEQTAISDIGLANLANLNFLEYLNLYKTQVTDAGLEQLKSLPRLKSVYLWQTGVTEKGIAQFVSAKPDIFVNKGVENDSIFGEVGLKPPMIKATRELFTDTLLVTMEAGFGNAQIRFTTDGSEPDSASTLYEQPVLLEATRELKARAFKEGWTSSSVISKNFIKVRYKINQVILAKPPDPRYKGEGEKTLIDLKKGGQNFRNGEWLGYEGQNLVASLDLGKTSDVSRVTIGGVEDTGAWIFFPKGMRVSTSVDGKNFKTCKEANYPVAGSPTQLATKVFSESFKPVQARFVKVEVLSVLKNPNWHPGAGKPCWVFVDEILVE
jgi:uncharacterized membrane protein